MTFEQTDGKFAITKDGLFAERDADGKYYTRGGCLMPKQDENGYVYNDYGNIVYEKKQRQEVPASDIVYDTYDFNFTGQTMEGMQLQNAVRVKDENSTKDSAITEIEPFDGVVPGEIYLIADRKSTRLNSSH